MRYILNNEGYIYDISFGADIYCELGNCTQYTGEIPSGYTSLEEWHDNELDRLNAWKVVDGNLLYDPVKDSELQQKQAQEEQDNRHITNKELEERLGNIDIDEEQLSYLISNAEEIAKMLPVCSNAGKLIQLEDASNNELQEIVLTTENALQGKIQFRINGNNLFKTSALNTTDNGLTYVVNNDKTISINGSATNDSELLVLGNKTNIEPVMALKKDTNYYLGELPVGVSLNMYSWNGDSPASYELVYSGSGGEVLNFSTDKQIMYATLNIEAYNVLTEAGEFILTEAGETVTNDNAIRSTFLNEAVSLMLSLKENVPYEVYKEHTIDIDLQGNIFEATDTLKVDSEGNVTLAKASGDIALGTVDMVYTYEGYNSIFTLQDTNLSIKYKSTTLYTTAKSTGMLHLENTYEGYGAINKLEIKSLTGGNIYTLWSADTWLSNEETYEIDLTNIEGTVDLVIQEGYVYAYQNGEQIAELGNIYIKTFEGVTNIYVLNVNNLNYVCEYMLKSVFTECFATRTEKNASFTITQDQIKAEVSRATAEEGKLRSSINVTANEISSIVENVGADGEVTAASIVQSINDGSSSIKIDADHIDIEGKVFPTIQNEAGTCVIDTLFENASGDGIEYTAEVYHQFNGSIIVNPNLALYGVQIKNTDGDEIVRTADTFINIGQSGMNIRLYGNITVNGEKIEGIARFG